MATFKHSIATKWKLFIVTESWDLNTGLFKPKTETNRAALTNHNITAQSTISCVLDYGDIVYMHASQSTLLILFIAIASFMKMRDGPL